MSALPVVFVSHGAPTLAIEPGVLGPRLTALGRALPRPRAVLVVSPHWMSRGLEVATTDAPRTIHDFGGFPQQLYTLTYPAPGAPALAAATLALLQGQGLAVKANATMGLDHGAWVPLRYLYPDATVPVFQLSMRPQDGPRQCLELGRALAPLREQGVLIVASGSLTHNLYEFMDDRQAGLRPTAPYASEFCAWIDQALAAGDTEALLDYRRRAPHATRAHPTDDHLLPLFIAVGAASATSATSATGGGRQPVQRLDGGVTHGMLVMDAYVFDSLPLAQQVTGLEQVC